MKIQDVHKAVNNEEEKIMSATQARKLREEPDLGNVKPMLHEKTSASERHSVSLSH